MVTQPLWNLRTYKNADLKDPKLQQHDGLPALAIPDCASLGLGFSAHQMWSSRSKPLETLSPKPLRFYETSFQKGSGLMETLCLYTPRNAGKILRKPFTPAQKPSRSWIVANVSTPGLFLAAWLALENFPGSPISLQQGKLRNFRRTVNEGWEVLLESPYTLLS